MESLIDFNCQIMKIFQNISFCSRWYFLELQLFSQAGWCQPLRKLVHSLIHSRRAQQLPFHGPHDVYRAQKPVLSMISLWSFSLLSVLLGIICTYMETTYMAQQGESERLAFAHLKLCSLYTTHWASPTLRMYIWHSVGHWWWCVPSDPLFRSGRISENF